MENGSCNVENGSVKWKMEVGKWKSEMRSGMAPTATVSIVIYSDIDVSGNCFPRIDNISIPGNMFPRTSKGRQICDVPRGGVEVLFLLMPIHLVTESQRRWSVASELEW